MYISYFDEAGDDGFPKTSSPLFVLTSTTLHHLNWKDALDSLVKFRRELRKTYNIPVKWEIHCRYFLLNKHPYRSLNIADADRMNIVSTLCELIGQLSLSITNVVIVKPKLTAPKLEVLDTALSYAIQRIENTLKPTENPNARFMIITDEGRIGAMRKTSRRVQRINFIPSKFGTPNLRKEIKTLIEDPLPKNSQESHFIQMTDVVATIVYLYVLYSTGVASPSNRMKALVSAKQVQEWMEKLKTSLNLLATKNDPFGVVMHPRQ